MPETEIFLPIKNKTDITLIQEEYEVILENLQQDLKKCKVEQIHLRTQVEELKNENKAILDTARDAFSHTNITNCSENLNNQECIENLKSQISLIKSEKESIFQLWQVSLKAVETLEQEIKTLNKNDKANKLYDEEINNVKKAYLETIQLLEYKFVQTRDNLIKHQVLWESSKEKLENLKREKINYEKIISNLQEEILIKEKSNEQIIEGLKTKLNTNIQELEAVNKLKLKLENELMEVRCFAARMTKNYQESNDKVAETLELIETAVKEKEIVLEREAKIVQEKCQLEYRLANLSDEYSMKLNKELNDSRKIFNENSTKYTFEIKELKTELRDKATLVDRVQREYRLLEEELQKTKYDMNNSLQISNSKIVELENKLKEAEYKINTCEENCKQKYEEKIRQTNKIIVELEDKLSNCNDKLRRNQANNLRDVEERVKDADDRVKETVDKYLCLEKRLARALDDRENFSSELRTIQINFDKEIARRDNERRFLENRVRELVEDLKNANNLVDKTNLKANSFAEKIEFLEKNMENRIKPLIHDDNVQHTSDLEKSSTYKIIHKQYEEKINELNNYVKIHKKLSNRWKEEAQSLATKFQNRYKQLRSKLNLLKNENEELNKELIICRQQVVVCRSQLMQRFDQEDIR